jgi:hypothetical protein
MKPEEIKYIKIPLKELLEILTIMYETGYDYIDITGIKDEDGVRDVIRLDAKEEYYSENPNDDDNDDDSAHRIEISLN